MAFAYVGSYSSITSTSEPFSLIGFKATPYPYKSNGANLLVQSFDDQGDLVGSYQTTLGAPSDGDTFIDLQVGGGFDNVHSVRFTFDAGNNLVIDDMIVSGAGIS